MGINPPSLYAAFGNKEDLFRKALDRYVEMHDEFLREALARPKATRRHRGLAEQDGRCADRQINSAGLPPCAGDRRRRRSCPVYQGSAVGSGARPNEKTNPRAPEAGEGEGELPANADPAALARFIATVTQGMAVQAAGGASRKELEAVAATAMAAWPEKAPLVLGVFGLGVLFRLRLQEQIAGRRLPDELLDPLRDVRGPDFTRRRGNPALPAGQSPRRGGHPSGVFTQQVSTRTVGLPQRLSI